MQRCELRDRFRLTDPSALLVAQIFDLSFDQIQRIDAPYRLVPRGSAGTLRIGQGLEGLEEASSRVRIILLAR